jgi:nucleotide-binding universal stress UspA family protein
MMINIKHILYATDNSKNAREAYEYARSIAHQYDAKLTLLHVIQDSFDLSVFDINMGRSSSEKKWLETRNDYLEKRRQEITDAVEAEYSKEGVNADHIIVEEGVPSTIILHMADEKKCDFIVMGMKGRGRTLEEAIMGDTVRRVLHRSKLPVLVVEPIEEKV